MITANEARKIEPNKNHQFEELMSRMDYAVKIGSRKNYNSVYVKFGKYDDDVMYKAMRELNRVGYKVRLSNPFDGEYLVISW